MFPYNSKPHFSSLSSLLLPHPNTSLPFNQNFQFHLLPHCEQIFLKHRPNYQHCKQSSGVWHTPAHLAPSIVTTLHSLYTLVRLSIHGSPWCFTTTCLHFTLFLSVWQPSTHHHSWSVSNVSTLFSTEGASDFCLCGLYLVLIPSVTSNPECCIYWFMSLFPLLDCELHKGKN